LQPFSISTMSSSCIQKHEISNLTASMSLDEPNRITDADKVLWEIRKLREQMERLRKEDIQEEEENRQLSQAVNDLESAIKFARFASKFAQDFKVNGILGYGFPCESDMIYVRLEFQLGKCSLDKWLSENSDTDYRELIRVKKWFGQIVSAVKEMHNNNLIHRDLKPGNIVVISDEVIKICDLGIA
ncbi:hypothetical protein PENTCL1PPCAC_8546, partial [Pristionchus entomophagus]